MEGRAWQQAGTTHFAVRGEGLPQEPLAGFFWEPKGPARSGIGVRVQETAVDAEADKQQPSSLEMGLLGFQLGAGQIEQKEV